MLTLIGREIRDHMVYVVGLGLVMAITIAVLIAFAYEGFQSTAVLPLSLLAIMMLLGFCALGAGQMYGDRANRISPLLSTLAVTRNRIFAARVVTGVLVVLLTLAPIIVATVILLQVFVPPFEFYRRLVVETSVMAVLMGTTCYSLGLLAGWTSSKSRLFLGSCLPILGLSIVGVKGFGPEAMLILLIIIGAALVCTWHKFTSASL
jgi:ABC-type transport system involved in multi-copper enzyme maturation permease subunit